MKVDIWSDVVCPWCYIGKRRFEAALASFAHRDDVELTWHSFQLDPSAPATIEGDYRTPLARKFGRTDEQVAAMLADMATLAAQDGLDYRYDLAQHANTFDAHRLLHLAKEHGVQDEMKERLFAAVFTQGRTVSDPATLRELGVAAGLGGAEVDEMLAGERYADEVRADIDQAAEYGISGVPFIVIDGRYGVSGAQPAQVLAQTLERAWAEQVA